MKNKIFDYLQLKFKPVAYLKRKHAIIGDNVFIDKKGFIPGSEPYLITIGNNVRIASFCTFINHDGSNYVVETLELSKKGARKYGKITIGNNVFVGMRSTFLPDSGVGNNVIVGYGSIVTKHFGDNVVVAGSPAKVICSIDEYAKKNLSLFCESSKEKDILDFLNENTPDS